MNTNLQEMICVAAVGFLGVASCAPLSAAAASFKFDFGSGPVATGYTQVLPTSAYSREAGFGFEPGVEVTALDRGKHDALRGDTITSDKPFLFSVAVPEGNYRVTMTLGDGGGESNNTIKAEARRLILENVNTMASQFETRSFTINVKTPQIPGNPRGVGTKPGELGPALTRNWDEKLTLEFNGTRPCVAALEITKVEDALTVFVAGDSTVTDGSGEPWASWGQMLPRFFNSDVAVSNYAVSGLSAGAFLGQRRLEKILTFLKPSDYVLIQFGHNDQKENWPGAGPFTHYKANLKTFVTAIREKGGVPVIVTSMERRRWSREGEPQETLTDFAEAGRQVGREENVPVIDLHAMSLKLYKALGPERSKLAFMHYPPLKDDTHFNNYGGYQLARSVVEGIKVEVPELAKRLADDVKPYDPSQPDPPETFHIAASPPAEVETPEGS